MVQIGGFRVGLCHGHQVTPAGEVEALASLHRSLDVDVLITGELMLPLQHMDAAAMLMLPADRWWPSGPVSP